MYPLKTWLRDVGEYFTDGFLEIPINRIPIENLIIIKDRRKSCHNKHWTDKRKTPHKYK